MTPRFIPIAACLAILIVFGMIGESFAYRRYTGLKHWQAVLLGFATAALAGLFCIYYHEEIRLRLDLDRNYHAEPFTICAAVILPLLVMPFVVRLYDKLIGGHLTDAEKKPGVAGVRAWLGVGNVLCAGLIPVCVWILFGTTITPMLALTFGLVLVYPVLNLASAVPQTVPAAPVEDLSAEREKVLQLLEAGKITADESAELLSALGHSVPVRPQPKPQAELTPPRMLTLIGAGLLVIAFSCRGSPSIPARCSMNPWSSSCK